MKTLIFNGSAKKNGDTVALIRELSAHLDGEGRVISCYDNIAPCNDCRYCWSHEGCAVQDGMQEIYAYLAACDNVVLASPIWFSSLSGPLLSLASRLQTLYMARRFRNASTADKLKNGVILMVGAEPKTAAIPTQTALAIMKFMNVDRAGVAKIYSLDTDNLSAKDDAAALAACREVAERLNRAAGKI